MDVDDQASISSQGSSVLSSMADVSNASASGLPCGPISSQEQIRHQSNVTMAELQQQDDQALLDQVHTIPRPSHSPTVKATVPPNLPFLQLKGDYQWKPKEESFESAFDFCVSFKKVLVAHIQDPDTNWKRLLPLCLNGEQLSWLEENLSPLNATWEQAKTQILDQFDTPYRKFLLMAQVGTLRQEPHESNREYASRYQKLRREAGIEDGTSLAVSFFVSLRNSVKTATQVAIASRFGSSLPISIIQRIDLFKASDDSSGLVNYKANDTYSTYKRTKRAGDNTDNNKESLQIRVWQRIFYGSPL